ncbi:hypothetical protein DFJ43DRAFT_990967 [Lentinula guzmanii]|uniref:O-fucosyltransferase family protein n=1 Tax=Lentinula guzmanii TaxID=2804957 RepID=A0AA38JGW5_9AGAR|nr:hypothetical protein DFJ43DRAFT_990967 [Lentinula guzmanii]
MKSASSYNRLRAQVLLLAIVVALYLLYSNYSSTNSNDNSTPPYSLYADLNQKEEEIGQKFLESLELIETQKNPKFVLFRQHEGTDFGNQTQEILLHHHLALQSSRFYIYQPFYWKSRNEQLPLSAFLLGASQERAVPASFVEKLCPKGSDDVAHIKIQSTQEDLWNTALSALKRKEKCIIMDNPIIDTAYLSSPTAESIWPLFQKHLARWFQWSPQILDIVERTQAQLNLRRQFSNLHGEPYIALHLHRKEFLEHCKTAAQQHLGFMNWANLPAVLSTTLPPRLNPGNDSSVMEHCSPSLSRVMDAIDRQVRRKPYLRSVHIIHDGVASTDLRKLENALKNPGRAQRAGWTYGPIKSLTHSAMVPHEPEEVDFLVGADVELARRAEVFIGNGYSSLSSYIVALRMAGDLVVAGIPEAITLL